MDFEKFKQEFDAYFATVTDRQLIEDLRKAGVKFAKEDCDICNGVGYIQPKGQNARMICWKCKNFSNSL